MAYYRLHELLQMPDTAWGDQAAELQKALAIDPEVASRTLLPSFPDAAEISELRPYLVSVALVTDPADTTAYEALPALASWVAPADSLRQSAVLGRGAVPIEILVGADGVPLSVEIEGGEDEEELTAAVVAWRFTPAVAGGKAVAARIRYGERESGSRVPDSPQDD
jgi:hypothetical protein